MIDGNDEECHAYGIVEQSSLQTHMTYNVSSSCGHNFFHVLLKIVLLSIRIHCGSFYQFPIYKRLIIFMVAKNFLIENKILFRFKTRHDRISLLITTWQLIPLLPRRRIKCDRINALGFWSEIKTTLYKWEQFLFDSFVGNVITKQH